MPALSGPVACGARLLSALIVCSDAIINFMDIPEPPADICWEPCHTVFASEPPSVQVCTPSLYVACCTYSGNVRAGRCTGGDAASACILMRV